MTQGDGRTRKLYVGTHDGVCTLTSADGGAYVGTGAGHASRQRGRPADGEPDGPRARLPRRI